MRVTWHGSAFLPLMAGLTGLAWLTLWIWSASPFGRYLDHGSWTELGLAASLCQALPAGDVVLPTLLYVGGWLLMSAAMMLPTTLPLLELFRRVSANHPRHRQLLALVVTGYLLVWGAFGLAAHLATLGLLALVRESAWLTFNGWAIGALVLGLAGLFQFSNLKHRCLEACRTPTIFVARAWQRPGRRQAAFGLGLVHGLTCVGCCWALMLLMFVVGTGSVGWMLALGAMMAAEKNLPVGRKLSAPLGIVLLAVSATLAVSGIEGW